MGKLIYIFKTHGLEDYKVAFDLSGTDRQIEVPITVTDTQLQIAAMTHDLRTIMRTTMADQIAALDTVIAIGSVDSISIQKAYNISNLYGLESLFRRTVQSAIDKYIEAGCEMVNRIRESKEELK